jgi:hypothetical protein
MNALNITIYAHQIVNPPTSDSGCDIEIKFKQSERKLELVKKGKTRHQTEYMLSMSDASIFGISSSDNRTLSDFLNSLLLAFNLSLKRSALTSQEQSIAALQIIPNKKPSKTTVEDTPTGKKISIEETVTLIDSVFITMGLSEDVDENTVLSYLELIQNLKNVNTKNQILVENMKKSISEYIQAMGSFDRMSIFKHLFDALELAANYDGKNRQGDDMDIEVVKVVGNFITVDNTQKEFQSVVKEWRSFYGQTKHIDSKISKMLKFQKRKENVSQQLDPLRLTTQKMILERLRNLDFGN